MRGIGIQISRLEICKTKQNKGSLQSFFDKTEKVRTCKNIPEDNSKKRQLDLNVNEVSEKVDSSETLPNTESSVPTKDTSGTKTDNPPSSKSETIPSTLQAALPTLATETKSNETSHDRKANENIAHRAGTKDLPEKSSKETIQKQTSQENFFKHTKPSSGKSSKYEMPPRIQDLDMSVLIELPQDIRNEILDEYKRNKERSRVDATTSTKNTAGPPNEANTRDMESSKTRELCSQVDPDVLSALMDSDLHPDVRRDVQMYCDMKREATNGVNSKETNKKEDNFDRLIEQSQKSGSSLEIRDSADAKDIVDNTNEKEAANKGISRGDAMPHTRNQLCIKNDEAAAPTTCQTSRIEISHNDAALDKADTFILQNLSILHNNENVDKHQEMLINLVNHLFTLPLQQVPYIIIFVKTKSVE